MFESLKSKCIQFEYRSTELTLIIGLLGLGSVASWLYLCIGYNYLWLSRLALLSPGVLVLLLILSHYGVGAKVRSIVEKKVDSNKTITMSRLGKVFQGVYIVYTTSVCTLILEGTNGIFMQASVYTLINFALVLVIVSVMFLILGRCWWLSGPVCVQIFVILTGMFYTVILYRGTAVRPAEIFTGLRTLLLVSENIEIKYPFSRLYWGNCMLFFQISFFLLSVLLYFGWKNNKQQKMTEGICQAYLMNNIYKPALFCLSGGLLVSVMVFRSDIAIGQWGYTYGRAEKGILYSFIKVAEGSTLERPDNYGRFTEDDLVLEHKSTEEAALRPNIICVMNESFSDIRDYLDVTTSGPVTPFFDELKDRPYVESGLLVSPYVGGMTVSTEFEVISGLSTKYMPFMANPYDYIEQRIITYNDYFKELGYKTVFWHPFWGSSWGRDNAVSLLGFDKVYFGNSGESEPKWMGDTTSEKHLGAFGPIDEVEYIRSFLSDNESYKKVLDILTETEDPVFIFNTTIQNHGFYNEDVRGNLEYKIRLTDGVEDKDISNSITQYINLIHHSDEALKELITILDSYEEPVVLAFFGDHLPPLEFGASNINMPHKYSYDKYSEENMLKQLGLTRVPYIIWGNSAYRAHTPDVLASKDNLFSTNYLMGHILNYTSLPETDFSRFMAELEDSYPIISPIEGIVARHENQNLQDLYASFIYHTLVANN